MESEGLFTSSTILSVQEFLSTIGWVPALIAGVFIIGFGLLYVLIQNNLELNKEIHWESIFTKSSQILLGLILLVAGGLNGFFHFLPEQASTLNTQCIECQSFIEGLLSTGYMLYLVKMTELIVGVMLILGMFVPLALVLIAPVVLNIAMYHLFLDPSGLPIALIITVLYAWLAYQNLETFRPLFKDRKTGLELLPKRKTETVETQMQNEPTEDNTLRHQEAII